MFFTIYFNCDSFLSLIFNLFFKNIFEAFDLTFLVKLIILNDYYQKQQ